MNLFHIVAFVVLGALAACGTTGAEKKTTVACPAITGDTHIAQGDSTPGKEPVMMHVMEKKCVSAGANTFSLMAYDPNNHMDGENMAPSKLEVKTITALMTSMGHGTAEAPSVDANHKNEFTVTFQMPGQWKLDLTFVDTSVTTTTQAVSFLVDVK